MIYLYVAVGSAIGGSLRYWLSGLVANLVGQTFPWGTMVINITGSFAIALFGTLTAPGARFFVPAEWRQFFMVGVCGGYTTFSSFSLQTLNLAQDGEMLWAGANIGLSLVLCLIGAWAGYVVGQMFNITIGRG